jgi:transposase
MEHAQETIEKAIRMAKAGKSTPYISDSLGIPYNTVKAWVRGYYPIVRHPDEIKEKARKLISQGNNKLEVAAMLSVPYSTLVK